MTRRLNLDSDPNVLRIRTISLTRNRKAPAANIPVNLPGAVIRLLAATQFRNALQLFPKPESGWEPKVLTYSGFYALGIKEVWDMIFEYIDFVKKNGYFEFRRAEQSKYWMYESINEQLRNNFYQNPTIADLLKAAEKSVLDGQRSSFVAAKQLLDSYFALLH